MTYGQLHRRTTGAQTPRDSSPPSSSSSSPRSTGPFATLGEQLFAIRSCPPGIGSIPDRRLLEVQRRAQAAGASEQVPSDGGFLLQPDFSRQIVERLYATGEILSRCLQIPIAGESNTAGFRFPQFDEQSRATGSRLGGVQVFTESEAAQLIPTKPRFRSADLLPHKLTGLLYLTSELSQDSNAFGTWATYAFSQELLFTLETQIVSGTGAGQCLGIVSAPAAVIVPKETGQAASSVLSGNITQMLQALWGPSEGNAVWLYHSELLPQLSQLSTLVGDGGSESRMWQWRTGSDDYNRLCGIPALRSEYCAAPGQQGDLILADFSRYVVAMREMVRADISIHVLFLSDQQAFRFIMRVDGQPLDHTPITPANGTIATSPFVVLGPR